MFKKIFSVFILVSFLSNSVVPLTQAKAATLNALPKPGTMVNLSPAFEPVMIKGLTVNAQNPFLFDFMVDTGESGLNAQKQTFKAEADRLVKYFFASLSVPEQDLWVNLSPYEKGRIVPDALGKTEMGKDLLAEDYILKQVTSSLLYPEKDLGKQFWARVYEKAQQLYHTDQIPLNTFNKVWILADSANVYENGQTAWVINAHLKVMLEEDYLAAEKNLSTKNVLPTKGNSSTLSSQILRDIIIPEIEKEVNTGKNFATLRQIYNSMILATWYKKRLKQALLNQVFSNQNNVNGLERSATSTLNPNTIYTQYLQAYKKGVFNFISESSISRPRSVSLRGGKADEAISHGTTTPRKYFSGGFGVDGAMLHVQTSKTIDHATVAQATSPKGQMFKVQVNAGVNKPKDLGDKAMMIEGDDVPFAQLKPNTGIVKAWAHGFYPEHKRLREMGVELVSTDGKMSFNFYDEKGDQIMEPSQEEIPELNEVFMYAYFIFGWGGDFERLWYLSYDKHNRSRLVKVHEDGIEQLGVHKIKQDIFRKLRELYLVENTNPGLNQRIRSGQTPNSLSARPIEVKSVSVQKRTLKFRDITLEEKKGEVFFSDHQIQFIDLKDKFNVSEIKDLYSLPDLSYHVLVRNNDLVLIVDNEGKAQTTWLDLKKLRSITTFEKTEFGGAWILGLDGSFLFDKDWTLKTPDPIDRQYIYRGSSTDGSRVLFRTSSSIIVCDISNGNATKIIKQVDFKDPISHVRFSPEKDRVVFYSEKSDAGRIYMLDLTQNTSQLILLMEKSHDNPVSQFFVEQGFLGVSYVGSNRLDFFTFNRDGNPKSWGPLYIDRGLAEANEQGDLGSLDLVLRLSLDGEILAVKVGNHVQFFRDHVSMGDYIDPGFSMTEKVFKSKILESRESREGVDGGFSDSLVMLTQDGGLYIFRKNISPLQLDLNENKQAYFRISAVVASGSSLGLPNIVLFKEGDRQPGGYLVIVWDKENQPRKVFVPLSQGRKVAYVEFKRTGNNVTIELLSGHPTYFKEIIHVDLDKAMKVQVLNPPKDQALTVTKKDSAMTAIATDSVDQVGPRGLNLKGEDKLVLSSGETLSVHFNFNGFSGRVVRVLNADSKNVFNFNFEQGAAYVYRSLLIIHDVENQNLRIFHAKKQTDKIILEEVSQKILENTRAVGAFGSGIFGSRGFIGVDAITQINDQWIVKGASHNGKKVEPYNVFLNLRNLVNKIDGAMLGDDGPVVKPIVPKIGKVVLSTKSFEGGITIGKDNNGFYLTQGQDKKLNLQGSDGNVGLNLVDIAKVVPLASHLGYVLTDTWGKSLFVDENGKILSPWVDGSSLGPIYDFTPTKAGTLLIKGDSKSMLITMETGKPVNIKVEDSRGIVGISPSGTIVVLRMASSDSGFDSFAVVDIGNSVPKIRVKFQIRAFISSRKLEERMVFLQGEDILLFCFKNEKGLYEIAQFDTRSNPSLIGIRKITTNFVTIERIIEDKGHGTVFVISASGDIQPINIGSNFAFPIINNRNSPNIEADAQLIIDEKKGLMVIVNGAMTHIFKLGSLLEKVSSFSSNSVLTERILEKGIKDYMKSSHGVTAMILEGGSMVIVEEGEARSTMEIELDSKFKDIISIHEFNNLPAIFVNGLDSGEVGFIFFPKDRRAPYFIELADIKYAPGVNFKVVDDKDEAGLRIVVQYPHQSSIEVKVDLDQAMKVNVLNLGENRKTPGGIALNPKDMAMKVTAGDLGGVVMKVDQALLDDIKRRGVVSINPRIIRITPLTQTQVMPLLGLLPLSSKVKIAGRIPKKYFEELV